MWIRSQDKKLLVKANEVWVSRGYNNKANIECKDFVLAEYESMERAVEVLDEIVLVHNSQKEVTVRHECYRKHYVFQMPEK